MTRICKKKIVLGLSRKEKCQGIIHYCYIVITRKKSFSKGIVMFCFNDIFTHTKTWIILRKYWCLYLFLNTSNEPLTIAAEEAAFATDPLCHSGNSQRFTLFADGLYAFGGLERLRAVRTAHKDNLLLQTVLKKTSCHETRFRDCFGKC